MKLTQSPEVRAFNDWYWRTYRPWANSRDGTTDGQPVLFRAAGKQVLEGQHHYADARDEVAAALIVKALNRP